MIKLRLIKQLRIKLKIGKNQSVNVYADDKSKYDLSAFAHDLWFITVYVCIYIYILSGKFEYVR